MIKLLLNNRDPKIKLKLNCVLTAVNDNKLYLDFIPIFVKTWNKLYPETDVKIVLIAKNIPKEFEEYSRNIILFEPIENISTSFISQYIRILYPAILNYSNGILITDIDMLPMNREYFSKHIKNIPINKFVYMRDELITKRQFYICYNIATNKVWKQIFKINSIDDIKDRIKKVYNKINYIDGVYNHAWNTDQFELFKYVTFWNRYTRNLVILEDNKTKYNKIDRGHCDITNETIVNNIKNGKYTDYHCLRPFKKYEEINNKIFELL